MKKFIILILFNSSILFSIDFYTSDYDILLKKLDPSRSNDIIMLLEEGIDKIESSLNKIEKEAGLKLSISAIKRIGELKLTNYKPYIKKIMGNYNILSGKEYKNNCYVCLYNISLWTYNLLSTEEDRTFITNFILPEIINNPNRVDTLLYLIDSFGYSTNSKIALDTLHKLLIEVDNEIIGEKIIDSVVKHKKEISIAILVDKKKILTRKFSKNFIKLIDESITYLSK